MTRSPRPASSGPPVEYRFYAGKGGVGKTTCAAAHAVDGARAGRRTLLVSTDPAPSAGDALRQPLSSTPRPVRGTRRRLHAVEIRANRALERWLTPRRPHLEAIVARGTWLDDEDVSKLIGLSLPGIDELAALIELNRYGRSGAFDLVVADTAPTGHTLRMLAMPDLLRTLADVLDRMQHKHRTVVGALRGRWSPDEEDHFIDALANEARELANLVRDGDAATSWVTLAEPMAMAETADGLEELRRLGVGVDTVVINRVTPTPDRPCRWCSSRKAVERSALETFLKSVSTGVRLATVAARAQEPRGISDLAAIGRELAARPALPSRARGRVGRVVGSPAPEGEPAFPAGYGWSLLMCGGKGGVGKTTCACAIALDASRREPARSVLLLSADPAHSLGDALGAALGDEPRRVPGAPPNLTAREIDAAARFEVLKTRYARAVEGLFDRIGGGSVDSSHDRRAMRDLLELAPPGLDELIAIVEVSETIHYGDAVGPLVVLDTAPSGHALRLLETPQLVHDWVKALMGIVLKYQAVAGLGELGSVLLQTSQGLGRLRALLADPARTAFVAVTRPAALAVLETERLMKRLAALSVAVPVVFVNAVGAGTCGHCASSIHAERRALAALRSSIRGKARLVTAPGVLPPPRGASELARWRASWRAGPRG